MNELFVNIKVDREERPDIDAIYMRALHSLGEQGGWPLTMFLDSEARPFWGGTYFPPDAALRPPRLSPTCCARSPASTASEPDKVAHNAGLLVEALQPTRTAAPAPADIGDAVLADLTARMVGAVDAHARRPARRAQVSAVELLLAAVARRHPLRPARRRARRSRPRSPTSARAASTITSAAASPATRSTTRWLVPHFEKMLYDNALLIDLMSEVYRETGNDRSTRARIEETVALAAARDDRRRRRLRRLARCRQRGRGRQVLRLDQGRDRRGAGRPTTRDSSRGLRRQRRTATGKATPSSTACTTSRSARRDGGAGAGRTCAPSCWRVAPARIRPGWDDKVLADWNGLMIAALAHAAARVRPARVARRRRDAPSSSSLQRMEIDGRLIHSYRAGQAKAPATASDYANMIWAALRLLAGHQRARPFSPPPSAGAPCSTATTGWPTAAATPSPPTTRPT